MVRRRGPKQRLEDSPADGTSRIQSDRSNVPVELGDNKESRRRAGRPSTGQSRDLGDPFNTTQTNELLNVRHSRFDQVLHHVYYSPMCQYFYIGLLLIGVSLIVITIADGFKIAESPGFVAVELLLNITISIDLLCRMRLQGCKKYFKRSGWNKLDVFIVLGCNVLFIISLL